MYFFNVNLSTNYFAVSGYLSRYLGSLDNVYNLLFITDSWKERLENVDCDEIGVRIQRYLQQANSCVQLPISEAMLTCKEKRLVDLVFQNVTLKFKIN